MSDPVLRFDRVTRRFGATIAVDRLDLTVEPGSVDSSASRLTRRRTSKVELSRQLALLWGALLEHRR